ncbi:MAG: hypothetical protein KJN80_03430 [Deltaproteobacteria bacterium]|nr:hypothetical protein [Deltaproteobacteria bacterium]
MKTKKTQTLAFEPEVKKYLKYLSKKRIASQVINDLIKNSEGFNIFQRSKNEFDNFPIHPKH